MRRRRPASPIVPFLLILLVLCGGAAALIFGYTYISGEVTQTFGPPSEALSPIQLINYQVQLLVHKDELTQPTSSNDVPRPFQIEMGESVNTIALHLENAGFIPDAEVFRAYLIYAGLDTKLQAGEYRLSAAMPPLSIGQQLLDATPTEVTFQILKGWRMEEIAAALPTSGLSITPEEFTQAARHPQQVISFQDAFPDGATLEGFLYPDNYRLSRDMTVDEFLTTVSENFRIKVSADLLEAFSRQGLDLYRAVTLASIVQREAVVEEEQPIIASVFYNRIAAGMKLDSDPTVQYALGYNESQNTWWTNPLSLSDLQVDSPYNTYIYAGLPPGPIANPGLSALRAAAYPAQTPYYFFRARCDGSGRHEFAETFDEHVQNACE